MSPDTKEYSILLWHARPSKSPDVKYRSLMRSKDERTMVNAMVSCMATESNTTEIGKMANARPDHQAFSRL